MSANVVAILNSKGGSGKTTIAAHLAHGLNLIGPTLAIDSDPQGSLLDWHAAADEPLVTTVGMTKPTLERDVAAMAGNYDWIVIDGAAKLEQLMVSALKAADLVLVPVRPSPLDIWALADLVAAIKTRQQLTGGRPGAGFVINAAKRGTQLAREVRAALDGYELPVVTGAVHDRTVFARALATGTTALALGDRDAQFEIDHVMKAVLRAF